MTQTVRALPRAVSVKNASLVRIEGEGFVRYVLTHYNTVILEVENNEVKMAKANLSQSSNRAINQAFEYIGMPYSASDFKRGKYRGYHDTTEVREI